jgi:hypothetical protein
MYAGVNPSGYAKRRRVPATGAGEPLGPGEDDEDELLLEHAAATATNIAAATHVSAFLVRISTSRCC